MSRDTAGTVYGANRPVSIDGDPFFFGPPGHELFGCYHAPQGHLARDSAVLLCYPWGPEYLASHRAFLQLAIALSARGFPVLRFEYSGTGDSSGTAESSTLASWRADLLVAAAVLRDRAGTDQICLAGLRLGAALAATVAAEMPDISGLILWQPVVTGADYLDQLRERHQHMLWRSFSTPPSSDVYDGMLYQLGFPLSDALLVELAALTLGTLPCPRCPVLIVNNEEDQATLRLRDRLADGGSRVEHDVLGSFAIWHEAVDKGLVPRSTIDRISDWLGRHCP